jgi:hypothetical protein
MRDRDIRDALWLQLEAEHEGDDDTLMLDELSLCHGSTRVDLAVINGEIHGYEVKSERDTLERLEAQASIYNSTLNRVTLVTAGKHFDKTMSIVPEWWGLSLARLKGSAVEIETVRSAELNPSIDPVSLATLLWRDEALAALESVGCARGVRGKSRDIVYGRLADSFRLEDLGLLVRRTLKDRRNWRADRRQTQCDD